eukprot:TRINITY_DN8907_c0_g5_i2.p1 TRINITY_DN8907_c0_g5~~TRINITY_DN8907_c0_g5_i2.p1  ORF type:complete len:259 (+),score=57.57 TRINITY_DN8907_c0_g5_i2:96-872(+)
MIRRPPRSTLSSSSAASDVYKRQGINAEYGGYLCPLMPPKKTEEVAVTAEEDSEAGKGAQVYYDGSVRYEGEWGQTLRHGTGTYHFKDGNGCAKYEGNWIDGEIETRPEKLATCTFENGSVYHGECKGGKFHGFGKYSYFNGDCYEGQWQDNQRWGVGTYKQGNGWVYEGTWYKSKKHGEGFFTPGPTADGFLDEWKVGYLVSRTAITAAEITQRKEEAQAALTARRAAQLKEQCDTCLLYTSPSPRDRTRSRMPSSA